MDWLFSWVPKSANKVAYSLARWSLTNSFFGFFDVEHGHGPPNIVNIIRDRHVSLCELGFLIFPFSRLVVSPFLGYFSHCVCG